MKRVAVLVASAVLAAILLAWVAELGAWPAWVGVLLTSGVFLVVLAAVWSARSEPPVVVPEPEYSPPPPPPAPPRPALPITEVRLPSSQADYRFLLSAVVCWRIRPNPPRPLTADPADLAKREIVVRASQITAGGKPNEYDLVQHQLDSALSAPAPDRTGALDVWAQSVLLTLAPEDLRRQAELASIRKNEQVWEHSRRYQRSVRQYLRNEVLGDTGSVVVWYLAMDPKRIDEAVKGIGAFAQLSAAANNREVDPIFRHLVPQPTGPLPAAPGNPLVLNGVDHGTGNGFHFDDREVFAATSVDGDGTPDRTDNAVGSVRDLVSTLFGEGADDERVQFTDRIARLIEHYGDTDLAGRIRDEYDVPDFDAPPADPDEARDGEPVVPVDGPDPDREPPPAATPPVPDNPPRHAFEPFVPPEEYRN